MSKSQSWTLVMAVVAASLIAAACSGGDSSAPGNTPTSSEGTSIVANEPSDDTAPNDVPSTADTDPVDSASAFSGPHCNEQRQRCPRALTPTTWTGYHQGSPRLVIPLAGTRVLTWDNPDFQFWDLEDPSWGRRVALNTGLDSNTMVLLPDDHVLVFGRSADGARTGFVHDLSATDPLVPTTSFPIDGSVRARNSDSIVIGRSGVIELWNFADMSAPAHTLSDPLPIGSTLGSVPSVDFGPDGAVYISTNNSKLWRWAPPAEPELVAEQVPLPRANLILVDDDRLVLAARDEASLVVWDQSAATFTVLDGYTPSEDARTLFTRSAALPDGRILTIDSGGTELVFWNVDDPGTVTTWKAEADEQISSFGVLDDGRVVLALALDDGREVGTPLAYYSYLRVITAPLA